ncbi:WecB/TagA/CpsF family glycosyltransferase [Flavobacterium sp.]|jgi:N-acetylglucosaminyldiphosphoundecaprenol N-acetyl-beta-D-mannosaminyltransferase|uniref:WecB/TagA/CpsF family glycosyltransferase n=1 Tax=Flavobacterium sp. TaxID=239 RepID=UPI0037BE45AC
MINLLGFNIYINDLSKVELDRKIIINTINPHSYCISKKEVVFQESLKNSNVLLPDGIGIVWASQFLLGKKIKKIAGADVHLHFLNIANQDNFKIFYLGASDQTLSKIKKRITIEFPNCNVATFSPPFKSNFSEKENEIMLQEINSFQPDILFVGMTAPKQEKWVFHNKEKINARVICSIGAVFDFYAGNVKRASPFWIKIGLEWLPRLIKEPKRLFYRNFISTPKFILEVISFKIFGKGIL